MKFLVIAALSILLAAYSPALSNSSFVGPSRRVVNHSKCSRSPEACYAEAGHVCGGPYQIVDSESHAGGAIADLIPGPVTWYGLSYVCGRSDGRLASFPFRGPQYLEPGPP